nr:MAG: ORF1 [TTV-like mini virus]
MPWRNYYYRRRRRPRRFWRRRFRTPIYRRFWRRRYRVRKRHFKRKLSKLTIQEWQPPSIRKLTIKGYYPLFQSTRDRLSNNMITYLESIAPHYVPGGGGFSISCFSLNTLYKEHLKLHNWWTKTNDNYPLIRYNGCTLKLFKSEKVDYIFYYQRHYPMKASALMYTSTQPQILLLNNRKRIVKCKANNKKTKPYIRLRIPPPSQLKTKWYFQRDIANLPLLLTIATACSLDRPYLNSQSISNTVGFKTLNYEAFLNRGFKNIPTTGYFPKPNTRYFITQTHSTDPKNVPIGSLIFLGNTNLLTLGTKIQDACPSTTESEWKNQFEKYLQTEKNWGNPFTPEYLDEDNYNIWITNKTPQELKAKYKSNTDKLHSSDTDTFWTLKRVPSVLDCRYNPFRDDNRNEVYLLKITEQNSYDYHEPPKPELIAKDLPLWACLWGYIDYQKKAATYTEIDTTCICVILSHSLDPTTHTTFIPLDEDFLKGQSPFRPEHQTTRPDELNWHPKVSFQIQSLNNIACTGPYTAKLPAGTSIEGHMQYKFHFKLGGSPPPMATLTNPENQPKYPNPDNFLQTTSLQSPTMPIEHYLYNFDERRHILTKKAIKRMQTDKETQSSLLQITDSASTDVPTPYTETPTSESEDSEKEEETLQQRLLKQRKYQKQLQRGINKLLNRLANIQ